MEDNQNYITISKCIAIPLVLTFNIFSIKSLIDVNYNDVSNICSSSNIWYYLLTITLLSISSLQNYNNNYLEGLLSILGFFIWGSYELFGVSCINQLKNSNLYIISLAYWIFITIILGIIIIITLYLQHNKNNSIELPRTTSCPRTSNLDVSIHGSLINTTDQTIKLNNDITYKISHFIDNYNKRNTNIENQNQNKDINEIKDLNISFPELSRNHSNFTQAEYKV